MTESSAIIEDDLVRMIQTVALFIGMGDGYVSDEEIEWLDQEAPGLIRHCIRSKPAWNALVIEKSSASDALKLVPGAIEHDLSFGSPLGGAPAWMTEALNARRNSMDIEVYEKQFAANIEDIFDQVIAHYFALKMLYFSGMPEEGEIAAYAIMMDAWIGDEFITTTIESHMLLVEKLVVEMLGFEELGPSADT